MCVTSYVKKFYSIPDWYVIFQEEVVRLYDIILEADFDFARALSFVAMDCSAMCDGCWFCYPDEYADLSICSTCASRTQ